MPYPIAPIAERVAQPLPEDVREARHIAGLTQAEAARLISSAGQQPCRTWQSYEAAKGEKGHRQMPLAAWELFLLLTGQHPTLCIGARPSRLATLKEIVGFAETDYRAAKCVTPMMLADFKTALTYGCGQFDSWLELFSERMVRAHICKLLLKLYNEARASASSEIPGIKLASRSGHSNQSPSPVSLRAFKAALTGKEGALDAWLEEHSETEIQLHIGALADEVLARNGDAACSLTTATA